MVRKTTVAVCTLNQWAMDFEGNMNRILQSIQTAKAAGARYRGGPELEISGYTCEDHFLESDTVTHSWEVLLAILNSPISQDIIVDVGMPVSHRNCTYNCRVVFCNKNIFLIRPKTLLCDDGNYRESRWFTPWRKLKQIEEFRLPQFVTNATGQSSTVIGDGVIVTRDTSIGYEICEELWNPQSSHIPLSFNGVEIIVNGSGSYMELRKAYVTVELVKSATFKAGGCYLFNNLRGCDGGRVYFNGCSCVALNGNILARTQQFSLLDVEVATATVDLDEVASYRGSMRSHCYLSSMEYQNYPEVKIDVSITTELSPTPLSFPITWLYHTPEEEIALGPACWLWDYLRRSGQGGFFLPLSGGIDSASSAVIIFSMCNLIVNYSQASEEVLNSIRKIVSDPNYCPSDAKELCSRIFFTSYMATENSSSETKMRAKQLSLQIGSYHIEVNISAAVTALLNVFSLVTGMKPRFSVLGGSPRECLALQNVQARIRMVMAYLLAQLLLWARGRPGGLLVIGSANVDEALRGYMTKYDCSSADVNPIGGISKTDLRSFIAYAKEKFNLSSLDSIQTAPATAELLPLSEGSVVQTDEVEMGLTYEELSCMGRLRKSNRCGPLSTFNRLIYVWKDIPPQEVAEKVKHFYRCYALNRHKMTVLTPSIHAESYSPDDNRYDLRQFLYSISWRWQFSAIDKQVQALGSSNTKNLLEYLNGEIKARIPKSNNTFVDCFVTANQWSEPRHECIHPKLRAFFLSSLPVPCPFYLTLTFTPVHLPLHKFLHSFNLLVFTPIHLGSCVVPLFEMSLKKRVYDSEESSQMLISNDYVENGEYSDEDIQRLNYSKIKIQKCDPQQKHQLKSSLFSSFTRLPLLKKFYSSTQKAHTKKLNEGDNKNGVIV